MKVNVWTAANGVVGAVAGRCGAVTHRRLWFRRGGILVTELGQR